VLLSNLTQKRGNAQHIKLNALAAARGGHRIRLYTLQISWEYIKLCSALLPL
jgi:hypothetical protein